MKAWHKHFAVVALAVVLVASLGWSRPALAGTRIDGERLSIGAQAGSLFGHTELADGIGPQIRFYGDYIVHERMSMQTGVGMGIISGEDYRTGLTMLDLRMIARPYGYQLATPFAYVGIGLLHYNVDNSSWKRTSDAKEKGWTATVPVGVGMQWISPWGCLDLSVDFNYSFSDALNSARLEKGNDLFWGMKIGFDID